MAKSTTVVVPPCAAAIVGRGRAAKGHVEMRVHIDPAGQHQLAGGIDHAIGGQIERGPDRADLLALDQHIAFVEIGGGDNRAVLDQDAHGRSSTMSP
jgi:hypothetical protein